MGHQSCPPRSRPRRALQPDHHRHGRLRRLTRFLRVARPASRSSAPTTHIMRASRQRAVPRCRSNPGVRTDPVLRMRAPRSPRSRGCRAPASTFDQLADRTKLAVARGAPDRSGRQCHLPLPGRREPPFPALAAGVTDAVASNTKNSILAPVAGVDEAGRGPLAGPVVAAAVILPARGIPRGINDSKKLSATARARRSTTGCMDCATVGIGIVERRTRSTGSTSIGRR